VKHYLSVSLQKRDIKIICERTFSNFGVTYVGYARNIVLYISL
jgi:hypothetical protein